MCIIVVTKKIDVLTEKEQSFFVAKYIINADEADFAHCQFSEFLFTFIFWHYIHEEINNQDNVGFFFCQNTTVKKCMLRFHEKS